MFRAVSSGLVGKTDGYGLSMKWGHDWRLLFRGTALGHE